MPASHSSQFVLTSTPLPKLHAATWDSRSVDSRPDKLTTRLGSPSRLTTARKPERGEETDATHISSLGDCAKVRRQSPRIVRSLSVCLVTLSPLVSLSRSGNGRVPAEPTVFRAISHFR